jgi:hypothetical protein
VREDKRQSEAASAGVATSDHAPGFARVLLRLDPGTETISGTLEDSRGRARPFWGWLELSAALDEARLELPRGNAEGQDAPGGRSEDAQQASGSGAA